MTRKSRSCAPDSWPRNVNRAERSPAQQTGWMRPSSAGPSRSGINARRIQSRRVQQIPKRRSDMTKYIFHDHGEDGIDRRGFLKCMAWAGTGAFCVLQGGVLKSFSLSRLPRALAKMKGELSFVQISDSHIGFNKPANPDVTATLQEAVAKVNALPTPPAFALHTGDLTHLSKPEEFDTLDQVLKSLKTSKVFYVPGEHDVLNDNGKQYLERYGKGTQGEGWFSFDQKGVHFIGLVNVLNLKAGGLG